jgi:hypothetical protein
MGKDDGVFIRLFEILAIIFLFILLNSYHGILADHYN